MKVVYVAGPFRGRSHWAIAQNIRRAEALALEVWKLGAAAICPHLNTMHFQDECPDNIWLEGDLEILKRCDFVLTTHNWKDSVGTCAEVLFATKHNIPVFHNLSELRLELEIIKRSEKQN